MEYHEQMFLYLCLFIGFSTKDLYWKIFTEG